MRMCQIGQVRCPKCGKRFMQKVSGQQYCYEPCVPRNPQWEFASKENVQRDATDLFTRIANDKAYVGLRINDNYGLNIVLQDGTVVPGRSAGYEHVVALSLIGALHKNAPLQGPIIMDSPFGRLDPTHKRNIVSVLPSMANQVMLLVYTDEIDEQLTRESLAGNLISEKRLTRVSSMHTRIE